MIERGFIGKAEKGWLKRWHCICEVKPQAKSATRIFTVAEGVFESSATTLLEHVCCGMFIL